MSTNPPSLRLPFTLPEDVHPAVVQAIRYLFNGYTNHEQAFKALNAKVTETQTTATAASTTATATATQVATIAPMVAATSNAQTPPAGGVNDQTGNTAYILQQGDYGGLVIFNSASAIAVSANIGVTKPFFTKIWNNGAGTITVTVADPGGTPTGSTINGTSTITIAPGVTKSVYANSSDLNWSAA